MKRIESIFTNDHGRGSTIFAVIAVLALTVAIATVVVMSGEKRSVVADSLPAPIASVPQDPPSRYSVFMQLTANGTLLESETVFLDREQWTPVLEYNASIVRPTERGTSISTGRSVFNPIVLTKLVDKSSPLIMLAMRQNQVIEATFEFERPSSDTGAIETYYKIDIAQGRIAGIQKNMGLAGGDTETVSIVFNSVAETHETESVQDEWSWSSQN